MKRKINSLFILILVVLSYEGHAQIGGISNSKLVVLATGAIAHKTVEFEPALGFGWSNKAWNQDGELVNLYTTEDSAMVSSDFGFRLTYGLFKGFEIGVSLPTDISSTSWGAKYQFFSHQSLSAAAFFGANIPLGNKTYDKSLNLPGHTTSLVGGFVLGYRASDKLSFDVDGQYQGYLKNTANNHINDLFVNAEAGYYMNEGLQLCGGVSYGGTNYESIYDSKLWTLNLGGTVETGKGFVLIINVPVDLAGENNNRFRGFSLAATFTIE